MLYLSSPSFLISLNFSSLLYSLFLLS
jgi:hypothetical protein